MNRQFAEKQRSKRTNIWNATQTLPPRPAKITRKI